MQAFQIVPRKPYDRTASTREADPAYLRFIRRQPCIISGCKSTYQEAAHTGGRGLSRKADDSQSIPLCQFHHQTGKNSFHKLGRRGFESFYKLDIWGLIREFNEMYAKGER